MTAPLSPQQSSLLALVPLDGSTIGNTSLREKLGWDEDAYATVRDALVDLGLLEKGKGRGGAVRRKITSELKTELFAASEIESVIPELERARLPPRSHGGKRKSGTRRFLPTSTLW